MTTAAANNNSLFAATGSCVGANDILPLAPTSPSVDESSPLGGSSPTQDESSRELMVFKLTTTAAIDNSSIITTTVDGTANKSSTAPQNNYFHYQRDSRGDENKLCSAQFVGKKFSQKSKK